jgi:hypothetical protein
MKAAPLLGLMVIVKASLYALDHAETLGSFRLVTIEEDGTRQTVSQMGAVTNFTPGPSTIDSNASVLYYIGQRTFDSSDVMLVGVSLKTGVMISSVAIPRVEPNQAGAQLWCSGIAYASDLGELVLSFTNTSNIHILGTIQPTTGKYKELVTVNHPTTIGIVQPASFVYVPGKQTFVWQLGVNHVITQFAYDFKTGVLRNGTSPQITDFVYNSKDEMVWGHGVAVGPNKTYWIRTLVKMNSSTLKTSVVSVLGTLTSDGNGIALDAEAQIMYFPTCLYKDAGKSPQPSYLAKVSLTSASVISVSELLCTAWAFPENNGTCPATLNFL